MGLAIGFSARIAPRCRDGVLRFLVGSADMRDLLVRAKDLRERAKHLL
jgi:hypothetical protein